MNQLVRYIIIGVIITTIAFLLWYFSSIVAYILISAVFGLIGKPIVDTICRIKIKNWSPPRFIGATIALVALWVLFIAFFRIMIPLVVNQFNELGSVDVQAMVDNFSKPIDDLQVFIREYLPASAKDFSLKEFITNKITGIFSISMVANFFSSTANFLVSLVIALFSISFITFFFLKEDTLFYNGIIILFPQRLEQQLTRALSSVNNLLRRYFIGILIESTCIMILDTIGLTIVGIKFETAIVIGLIAGILNVVPYVGPLVGTIIGMLIGLAVNLDITHATQLLPLTMWMLVVFGSTQLIDNIVFQPLIYGNSVKAHPLEIFIVLLIAGSIAGILGMLLAIPSYTVIRVFAKEFFNNFRVVQKLTEKI
ncbi:MAG: AI-2E family transporter [Bacteroidales bacterium]